MGIHQAVYSVKISQNVILYHLKLQVLLYWKSLGWNAVNVSAGSNRKGIDNE